MLKKNGLVQLPVEVKQNYARFEIVEEKLLNRKNNVASLASVPPPSRLLIKREPTKLTADHIEEKLEKANQRKMVKFKRILCKIYETNFLNDFFNFKRKNLK